MNCSGTPAEIIFMIDSSTSIWPPHFDKQIKFVQDMIEQFDVGPGPDQIRIGVVSFSNNAHVDIHLRESTNKRDLLARVGRIKQISGNTNISDALYMTMKEVLWSNNGARQGVKKFGILMTDGRSQNRTATQVAADYCRQSGIDLFVIGIGHRIDYKELLAISSLPTEKFLIFSPTYNSLITIENQLKTRACNFVLTAENNRVFESDLMALPALSPTPSEENVCWNKKADVFFLLDSSSSIKMNNFQKQVNLITNIVRNFDVDPTKIRVGVAIYSHEYYRYINFDDHQNKDIILEAIGEMTYKGGGTKTGIALTKLRQETFNQRLMRPDAQQILIVFTDGQSSDYENTKIQSRLLKNSGVKIFVVAVGPYTDSVEIKDIASEPTQEFVHTVTSFDLLQSTTKILTYKACTAANQTLPRDHDTCYSSEETEVIFMIAAAHLGFAKTKQVLRSITEVVDRLGTHSPFTVGTLFDDCPANQEVWPGSIDNKQELINRISNFKYRPLSSLFHRLESSHEEMSSQSSTGGDIRKVAVLFIDHTMDLNERELQKEVNEVILEGTQIYVVVIGKKVNMPLLQQNIARGNVKSIIVVHSYDTLVDMMPSRLLSRLCKQPFNVVVT